MWRRSLDRSINLLNFGVYRNFNNIILQIEVETGKQTTFAEMKDCSVRCGVWLKKQGISANDIVVICSKNNLDVYAPIFGILYAGGTFAGWNPFIVALSKSIQSLFDYYHSLV